jgi:Na+-driven multidrug efflux pump
MIASAANSIGNKLQKISTTVLTAVDTGSGAMIGQNIGARKTERVKKIVLSTLAITLTAATIASAFALLCPRTLFGIFTMDKEVMELGVTYLKIMVITFYLAALLGTFQAVVTGVGFASFGFAIGMLDGVVCRIGFSLFFVYVLDWGVKGFFMGHAMARLIPFILSFLYYISGRWKKRKLLIESS